MEPRDPAGARERVGRPVGRVFDGFAEAHECVAALPHHRGEPTERVGVQRVGVDQENLGDLAREQRPGFALEVVELGLHVRDVGLGDSALRGRVGAVAGLRVGAGEDPLPVVVRDGSDRVATCPEELLERAPGLEASTGVEKGMSEVAQRLPRAPRGAPGSSPRRGWCPARTPRAECDAGRNASTCGCRGPSRRRARPGDSATRASSRAPCGASLPSLTKPIAGAPDALTAASSFAVMAWNAARSPPTHAAGAPGRSSIVTATRRVAAGAAASQRETRAARALIRRRRGRCGARSSRRSAAGGRGPPPRRERPPSRWSCPGPRWNHAYSSTNASALHSDSPSATRLRRPSAGGRSTYRTSRPAIVAMRRATSANDCASGPVSS